MPRQRAISRPLRIANCSGFYGDRLEAAREMAEGGPIDVLTGDYLAELTLAILHKDRRKDPRLGYAKTFLVQLRQIAATCLDRGIKIVVNAGGLNPAGCAEACRRVYADLGLTARVAHLEGDDLLPRIPELLQTGERLTHLDQGVDLATRLDPATALDAGSPLLSANAYLGGWGIAKALALGADLVICPRVTDAALVVGPAAQHFGWATDDWDALASAVVAGHILECGAQATGGNYAFFDRVAGLEHPGFPIAEIEANGDFTVTKHPGTGGQVSVGTVTAQLLYEIDAPRYPNPDVAARFDTLQLAEVGPDRVRVTGVRGEPPPDTAKLCLNLHGGFKNQATLLLTGLDLDAKARLATETLWARLGGREQFAHTAVRLHRPDPAATSLDAVGFLTLAVQDPNPKKVGRRFSSAVVEMALASYPGFNLTAPPSRETPYAVYWPALIDRRRVSQEVVFEGERFPVHHPQLPHPPLPTPEPAVALPTTATAATKPLEDETETIERPLGRLCGARSGDKGGNANLGVWVESDAAFAWLDAWLSVDRLRQLIPEARDLPIDRYRLPNLRALNFVLRGLLGEGVAASLATDAQAKGLGEFLRARRVPIPRCLLVE